VNAELGRPEASLAAADRLLSSPGALEASRLARVKAIREEQRQKLGEVLVTTPVDGVELSLSGRVVGQTPLPKPVLSRAGPVMLIATAKGYEPLVRELTVPAGGTLAVTLELVPTTVTPGSGVIRTSTPDTNVLVDGQLVGVTPDVTKVPLMPGARTLSVAREHYASAELVVNVSEGGVVDVPLEPTATPGEETAQVAVTSTEGSVTFTVDGLQGGLLEEKATARLVPGRHRLAFERGGFFPIRREVWLASSRVQTFDLVFEPTAELRAELTASRALRRIAGFTAIGLGAAGLRQLLHRPPSDCQLVGHAQLGGHVDHLGHPGAAGQLHQLVGRGEGRGAALGLDRLKGLALLDRRADGCGGRTGGFGGGHRCGRELPPL
jgi:hypothetical protein